MKTIKYYVKEEIESKLPGLKYEDIKKQILEVEAKDLKNGHESTLSLRVTDKNGIEYQLEYFSDLLNKIIYIFDIIKL